MAQTLRAYQRVTVRISQGQYRQFYIVDRDQDTGAIRNTTGSTYTMILAQTSTSAVLFTRLGVLSVPNTSGGVTFDVVEADTIALNPGTYKFNIWRKDPLGNDAPILTNGSFVIEDPIYDPEDPPTSPTPEQIVAYGLPSTATTGYLRNNPAGTLSWQDNALSADGIADGKVLTASGQVPIWADPPSGIPDPSGETDGEVLTISAGNAVWAAPPIGIPNPAGEPNGRALVTFGGNATWVDVPAEVDEVPDPSGEPDGKVLTTDSGAAVWLPAAAAGVKVYNILDYGGLGDSDGVDSPAPTDNTGPFNLILKAMDDDIDDQYQGPNEGGIIYFPPGKYWFSKTIRVNRAVRILGAGTHATSAGTTVFTTAKNKIGMRFMAAGINQVARCSRAGTTVTLKLGAKVTHAQRTSGVTKLTFVTGEMGIGLYVFAGYGLRAVLNDATNFPNVTGATPYIVSNPTAGPDTIEIVDPGPDTGLIAIADGWARPGVGPEAELELLNFLSVDETFYLNSGHGSFPSGYKIAVSVTEDTVTYTEAGAAVPSPVVVGSTGNGNGFSLGAGTASTVEGVTLRPVSGSTDPTAHGIAIHCIGVYLSNVNVSLYKGHGLFIRGGAPFSTPDLIRVHNCNFQINGRSGIFMSGSDSNACSIIGVNCSSNLEYGIDDQSGLGNGYSNCHTNGNVRGGYRFGNEDSPNPVLQSAGMYMYGENNQGTEFGGSVMNGRSSTIMLGGPNSEALSDNTVFSMAFSPQAGWLMGQNRHNAFYQFSDSYKRNSYVTLSQRGRGPKLISRRAGTTGNAGLDAYCSPADSGEWTEVYDHNGDTAFGAGWMVNQQTAPTGINAVSHGFSTVNSTEGTGFFGVNAMILGAPAQNNRASHFVLPIYDTPAPPKRYSVTAAERVNVVTDFNVDPKPKVYFENGSTAVRVLESFDVETYIKAGEDRVKAVSHAGGTYAKISSVVGSNSSPTSASVARSRYVLQPENAGDSVSIVATGNDIVMTNATADWGNNPVVGDILVIQDVDVFDGPSGENLGYYVVTAFTNTTISATKFQNISLASYALTAPVSVGPITLPTPSLTSAAMGFHCYAPKTITLSSAYTGATTVDYLSRARGVVTLTIGTHQWSTVGAKIQVIGAPSAEFAETVFPLTTFTATSITYNEAGIDQSLGAGGLVCNPTYQRGTIVWNTNPQPGLGGRAMAWMCTVGGTPGTWEPLMYINKNNVDGSGSREILLPDTANNTLLTYTPVHIGNPIARINDNFLVHVYYRVVTAATDITVTVEYTDEGGAQTQTAVLEVAKAVGSWTVTPLYINAKSTANIVVKAQAGTANQVYVTTTVQPVS